MHQKVTSFGRNARALFCNRRSGVVGPIMPLVLQCCLLLLAANVVFLAIRFADNLIPKEVVEASLRAGYQDGSMTVLSYPQNMLAGRDQYSDCIVAQIAVLGDPNPVRDALAPRILAAEQVGADMTPVRRFPCSDLKSYVEGSFAHVPKDTYTRFWHGASSILAAGLSILPVDGYRALLLNLTLGLIALTAVAAALASPRLLLGLAPLLAISFFYNGQVGYGQLFSYGPAQIALWSISAAVIVFRNNLSRNNLILLSVLSGASEAFLDQLISPPLVLSSFVIVAHLMWAERTGRQRLLQAVGGCASLFGAWTFGFLGSYAIKLVLTMFVLGGAPFHDTIQQFIFRAGTIDAEYGFHARDHVSRLSMFGDNFIALLQNSWRLGYASGRAGPIDILTSCGIGWSGWVLAIHRLIKLPRNKRAEFVVEGIPYLAASFFMVLWVIMLPEHTMRHAFFMVRSATIWIVGGWGWLCVSGLWLTNFRDGKGPSSSSN